jgi:FKBP-type peptidyl-prolyl cis-trans isomerase
MNKKQLLFFFNCFITLLFFNACNENRKEVDNAILMMDCGYQYQHFIQNEGPKPQVGEVAYYYFTFKADDSLLMDGRETAMISKMQIPKPLANPRKTVSPTLEGIKLMSVGDSMRVIVPIDSVPELPSNFKKFSNLYYDLVLLDIKSKEENARIIEEQKKKDNAYFEKIDQLVHEVLEDYKAGKLDDKITEKPSGLKYFLNEEGNGEVPLEGETVQVNYHAMLIDGRLFDSSFSKSFTFPVKVGAGSVIAGWDEGLTYLKRGSKATFFIPYDLGYGDDGYPPAIPPKAELVYYIELVK